ncbi:hypothetical protein HZA99_04890 [Candidatus Woesearchaeota archaeon]|nr:hypothetical protein [Candidatus Woesearchaeota archaeon]
MVLKVEFGNELEQQFRELAMRRYGFSKGSIKKASEEAISIWIKQQNPSLPKVKDPFTLIEGILSRVRGKYTAVQLQHEAAKLWIK